MSNFWPIDFCGSEVKQDIIKKSKKTNTICNTILVILCIVGVAMLPIWGDQKDLFLCVTVYEHYFGKWAKIPYYIYFFTIPFVAYSTIRLSFIMQYYVGQIQVQVNLINQVITKLSHEKNVSNIRSNKDYQDKVYKKICKCISHHFILKKYVFFLNKIFTYTF